MPPDQQQTPSGYLTQVMMPADKDWEKNQAPVLMSVKEQKKADEEPTAEGLPLTDFSMQADQQPQYSNPTGTQDQMQYPSMDGQQQQYYD